MQQDFNLEAQGIEMLRMNCPAFQKYELQTKQIVGDMLSCINMAVHRMRNAESAKEADAAYQEVMNATGRVKNELPANKDISRGGGEVNA